MGKHTQPRMPNKKTYPRGKQRGRRLTELQKETIAQIFALTRSFRETARQTGLSPTTVTKYVKSIPPAELAKRRADTQLELAGRFHEKTIEVLDSITPEDLKKSSLSQKSLAAGIFTDKQVRLIESADQMEQSGRPMHALTPQTLQDMIVALRNRIDNVDSIGILAIKMKDKAPDLVDRLDAAMAEAEILASEPLTVQSEDEFDGFDAQPSAVRESIKPVE